MTASNDTGPDRSAGSGAGGNRSQADAVAAIIDRFGGVPPMAKALGLSVDGVQAWKDSGLIPSDRLDAVRRAAADQSIALDPGLLSKASRATDVDAATVGATTVDVTEGNMGRDPAVDDGRSGTAADEADSGPATPGEAAAGAAGEVEISKQSTSGSASDSSKSPKAGKASTANAASDAASDAKASQTHPVAPPAPVARKGGGGAVALALLSLVVAGAALTAPYWSPIAEQQLGIKLPVVAPARPTVDPATVDPAALTALRQRLDGLGRQVDDLAARPASSDAAGGSQPGAALTTEIESLTTRLGDLVGRVDGTDQKVTELSALIDRIDSLAKRVDRQETVIGKRLDGARTGLQEQIAALSSRIDSTDRSVDDRLATIGGRIEDATQAAERRATQAAGAVLSAEIGTLDSRIDTLESQSAATANLDIQDIEDIRGRVTAVETQMRNPALRTRVSGIADSLDALRSRMAALSDRIDALRQALDNRPVFDPAATAALRSTDGQITATAAALAAEVVAIGRKVNIIQDALDAGAGVRAADVALILAIGQMAQDVRGSGPFETAFKGVEAMAARVFDGDMPAALTDAMDVLRPVALTGVASLPDLQRRYTLTAVEAARRNLVPEDADFVDRTVARLTDLVMIRKVDAAGTPETDGARLARAESRLSDGNLAEAVAMLQQIEGPAASALSNWMQAAESRLRAETAIRKLVAWATDRLPDLDAPLTTGAAPASGSDG